MKTKVVSRVISNLLLRLRVVLLPWLTLDDLRAECQRLQKDNTDILMGKVTLEDLAVRNGCVTGEFGGELVGFVAKELHEWFLAKGGVNYVSMDVTDGQGHKYEFYMRRLPDGATPQQLLEEERRKTLVMYVALRTAARCLDPRHFAGAISQVDAAIALGTPKTQQGKPQ